MNDIMHHKREGHSIDMHSVAARVTTNQSQETVKEKHNEPVEVTRLSLTNSLTSDLVPLPDEIRDKLPVIPDHIQEARRECTYQFIETVLLPRLQMSDEKLTLGELAQKATTFKRAFREKHPEDFIDEYQLVSDVETTLFALHLYYREADVEAAQESETPPLVARALLEIRALLDDNFNDLIDV